MRDLSSTYGFRGGSNRWSDSQYSCSDPAQRCGCADAAEESSHVKDSQPIDSGANNSSPGSQQLTARDLISISEMMT